MPSHASLHISPNVCHVTSHHPPHPPTPHHPCLSCIPTHIPQCLSCYFTPPTPHHPCLPMHSYTYPPMFVMLLHTTYPTPPRPTHPPHTSNPCLPIVGLKIFYIPPKIFSVCGRGSKNFLYPPEKFLVCMGGSKNWNWQIPWNINCLLFITWTFAKKINIFFISPQIC